ncbi:cerebellin-3-like [Mya arenaria]|uniref:cerebellin-3-like n=1 Tax=Mya arenaria TaxID=6604 RepID=UPI0022E8CCDA|nr:cerebellin-3-like [Mya arenaria]
MAKVESENAVYGKLLTQLNEENQELRERVTKLEERHSIYSKLPPDLNNTGGNQRLKRQELPYGTVAFYAALSRTVANLGVNQNIVFDHVILNEGNGYSGHAGDFRAPVSGIYAFSVSLQSYYGHSTHYTIMQGTTLVGKLYVDGHAAGMENSGMSFVLKLQKNEDVSVKNADLGENLHGDHYTSFSGFLVAEIEDSPVVG